MASSSPPGCMFSKYTSLPSIDMLQMRAPATSLLSVGSGNLNKSGSSLGSKTDVSDGVPIGRGWSETPAAKAKRRAFQRRLRLNTELLEAIEADDEEGVERSLDHGANVDAVCSHAQVPALFVAVVNGNKKILEILLERRCTRRPLAVHLAAWANQLECLKVLENMAAYNNLVKYVLEENPFKIYGSPSIECRDSLHHDHASLKKKMPLKLEPGSTPLHIAAANLSLQCVIHLLESGADVTAEDKSGMNPLDVVGELRVPEKEDNNSDDDDVEEELENDLNKLGETLCEVVLALLTSNARPTTNPLKLSKFRTSALHTAVAMRSPEAIRLLAGAGATLFFNPQGMTPVHWAIHHRSDEGLKVLLELYKTQYSTNTSLSSSVSSLSSASHASTNSAVDAPTHWGNPPLHMAVESGWLTGVWILLEAGADVTLFNPENESVLHLAVEGSYEILAELLNIPEVQNVLEKRDKKGATPLLRAVSYSPKETDGDSPSEVVAALLHVGAKCDARWPISECSALHNATETRRPGVLRQLLENNASEDLVNACDKLPSSGRSPLHFAAQYGYAECVEILLSFKAEMSVRTRVSPFNSATPLHLAATEGHVDASRVLAEAAHAANALDVMDAQGLTPLHCAARNGHQACISVLVANGADLAVISNSSNEETALGAIITYVPRPIMLLEKIFDARITSNKLSFNDRNCVVTLDYSILMPRGDAGQMRVIYALITSGNNQNQQSLLIHPLIQSFLYFKWQKMKFFFYGLVLIYTLFLGTYTAFILNRYYSLDASLKWINFNNNVCEPILWASLGLLILQESIYFYNLPKYYLMELESWHKIICFILTIISVSVADDLTDEIQWPRDVSCVAILLAWTELMILCSRMPRWGYHVLMFSRVAENVFKIFLTFSFLLIGFSLAFLVQFHSQGPFSTIFTTIIKTIIMTGEIDYGQIFDEDGPGAVSPYVGRLVLVMFVLLVSIVLMNLLVGMAVSDIAELETKGKTVRWVKRANFINILEVILYNTKIMKCLPQSIRLLHRIPSPFEIFPGRPRGKVFKIIPNEIRDTILDKVKNYNENRKDSISLSPSMKPGYPTTDPISLSKALKRMNTIAVGVTTPSAAKTSISKGVAKSNDFLALWFQSAASSVEALQRIHQAMKITRPLVMVNQSAREHFDKARAELRLALNQLDLSKEQVERQLSNP